MIQAVSSFKTNNSKGIFPSHGNISFKGNLANEAAKITKKMVRELPLVKKPLIAPASDLIHIIGDGQGVVRIPLENLDVTEEIISNANDIIVPQVIDLASELASDGASAAGRQVVGTIAEELIPDVHESAIKGAWVAIKEVGKKVLESIAIAAENL